MAVTNDPKALTPGTRIVHRSGRELVLSHRKADDSGWWNEDGSGFADGVLGGSDDFALAPREVDWEALARQLGEALALTDTDPFSASTADKIDAALAAFREATEDRT